MFSIIPVMIEAATTQIDLNDSFDFSGSVWPLFNFAWIILLLVFLIFKPDLIVKWLRLDKGFDEDRFDFQNVNTSNILKLAVIIIGGLLLIRNVPIFLCNSWFALKSSAGSNFYNENKIHFGGLKDYLNLGVTFINIVIGYFLVTNYNFVSKLLKDK